METLALVNLGQTYIGLGRAGAALACSRQGLDVAREIGYRQIEGTALSDLAAIYRAMRKPGQARDCYRQALAVHRRAGDRHGEAETLRDLGDLSGAVGHPEAARRSWRRALAILEALGDARGAAPIRDRLERSGPPGSVAAEPVRHGESLPNAASKDACGGSKSNRRR